MIDHMADWISRRVETPYISNVYGIKDTPVLAARSKTGMVVGNLMNASRPHLEDGMAVVFENGRARYGARFLCAYGSTDVSVVADAEQYGGVCAMCADITKGPCVYRCFGDSGELLYIGSAKVRLRRMNGHASQTPWWPDVADVQVEYHPTLPQARAAELQAILTEGPLLNRKPKGRRLQSVAA